MLNSHIPVRRACNYGHETPMVHIKVAVQAAGYPVTRMRGVRAFPSYGGPSLAKENRYNINPDHKLLMTHRLGNPNVP